MLSVDFNPDWKVGQIIRPGDGKTYKITKKTTTCLAVRRYYFWNKWLDWLSQKL